MPQGFGEEEMKIKLNKLGEDHLLKFLQAYYFACSFKISEFVEKANKALNNKKSSLTVDNKFGTTSTIYFDNQMTESTLTPTGEKANE